MESKGMFTAVPKLVIIGMFCLASYFVIRKVNEESPKIGESVFGGGVAVFVDKLFTTLL